MSHSEFNKTQRWIMFSDLHLASFDKGHENASRDRLKINDLSISTEGEAICNQRMLSLRSPAVSTKE